METHPIPQNISSYQFRLVGDMTLKQFFQIAGGALVSLIIYSTNLYPLIKWPLILFFALFGVALAFLPFQERPLERWIVAFFRSVYSPTIFDWKKADKPEVYFQEEAPTPVEKVIYPGGEEKLNQYLAQTATTSGSSAKTLEKKELSFLANLAGLFTFNQKPIQSPALTSTPLSIPGQFVPQIRKTPPKLVLEETLPQEPTTTMPISPMSTSGPSAGTIAARFSLEAAPPNPPTTPNTIVGQVITPEGKIIEGAILEVKDAAGRPVRALKSNKVGHFLVVTPLQNGKYEVITEKDGFEFKPISFEAFGGIIPPIAVEGKQINANAN
jgi:hypothetical protein